MMSQQITKTVYTFKELLAENEAGHISGNAVEKARYKLVQWVSDYEWYDCVYNDWQSALDQIGFEDIEINFSGFSSQGDGASFVSPHIDVEKLIHFLCRKYRPGRVRLVDGKEDYRHWLVKKLGRVHTDRRYRKLLKAVDRISMSVKRDYACHYYHENSCDVVAEFDEAGETGGGPDYKWVSHEPELGEIFTAFEKDVEELRYNLCRAIYHDLEEEYDYEVSDESLIDASETNRWTFDSSGDFEPV